MTIDDVHGRKMDWDQWKEESVLDVILALMYFVSTARTVADFNDLNTDFLHLGAKKWMDWQIDNQRQNECPPVPMNGLHGTVNAIGTGVITFKELRVTSKFFH